MDSYYFAGWGFSFIELSNCQIYVLKNGSNPTLKSPSGGILFYCWTDVHILNPMRFTLSFFFIFLKKQQYLNLKQITQHRWLRKHWFALTINCCVNCNQPGDPYRSVFRYFCDLTRMSMSNISEKTLAMNKMLYNENLACSIFFFFFFVITKIVNKHQ